MGQHATKLHEETVPWHLFDPQWPMTQFLGQPVDMINGKHTRRSRQLRERLSCVFTLKTYVTRVRCSDGRFQKRKRLDSIHFCQQHCETAIELISTVKPLHLVLAVIIPYIRLVILIRTGKSARNYE